MDGEKRIRAYIGPAKAAQIIGLIGLIIGLAAAVLCLLAVIKPTGEPKLFQSRGTPDKAWSYIDAVGVSDWVFRDDDVYYHIVEDAQGEFYVVRLAESRYRKMTAQQAYWKEETTVKTPARLTGMTKAATSTMRSYITQALDIPLTDYGVYLGSNYLDTSSTPNSDSAWGWGVLAFFALLLGAILSGTTRAVKKKTDAALEALGGYGAEQAANELEAPTTLRIKGDQLRLGENHLFAKRKGLLLRYDQVRWAYQQVQRYNFIVTGRNLMLGDENGRLTVAASFGRRGEEKITELIGRIAEKNPELRLGYSAENQKAWRELVKSAKTK